MKAENQFYYSLFNLVFTYSFLLVSITVHKICLGYAEQRKVYGYKLIKNLLTFYLFFNTKVKSIYEIRLFSAQNWFIIRQNLLISANKIPKFIFLSILSGYTHSIKLIKYRFRSLNYNIHVYKLTTLYTTESSRAVVSFEQIGIYIWNFSLTNFLIGNNCRITIKNDCRVLPRWGKFYGKTIY